MKTDGVYSGQVEHPVLGIIHLYWGTDRLIKGVYFNSPAADLFAVPADIKKAQPVIYNCLSSYPHIDADFSLDLLDLSSYTEFFRDIYKALAQTAKGELITYGYLARKAGYPNAARACGTAMRKNLFPLLIPCHRVVGANGPGGYSMGGLLIKKKILELEGVIL